MSETVELSVSGMHCANCGLAIDDAVEELTGVVRCTTVVRRRRTTVTFDPAAIDTAVIVAAIAEVGYGAAPVEPR